MNIDQIYKKKSNCVVREVDDELVIVPVRDDLAEMDYLYTLNETALFVWYYIDGKMTPRAIARELTQKYEVDDKTAEQDVLHVLKELEEFLEPVN